MAAYEVLKEKETTPSIRESFTRDILISLSESPKRIPSRYFYDAEGNRLFQQIMELPEYYLTGCEFEIFRDSKEEITEFLSVHGRCNLIELGPGDGRKTRILIEHFLKAGLDFEYVPIDISESAMDELIPDLRSSFSGLQLRPIVSEYFNALYWLKNLNSRRNFVLFLGSNIGNFNAQAGRVFLRSLWNALNADDYVLIGFDLKKDIDLLLKAYNDSQGVTTRFNLNLLERINRELGGNFDIRRFRHFGTYNVFSGAMESYLVSLERQSVFIQEIGQSFSFEPWEPIHTEYSYKYLESDILKLAEETGFVPVRQFYDSRSFFTDCIWRVQKSA